MKIPAKALSFEEVAEILRISVDEVLILAFLGLLKPTEGRSKRRIRSQDLRDFVSILSAELEDGQSIFEAIQWLLSQVKRFFSEAELPSSPEPQTQSDSAEPVVFGPTISLDPALRDSQAPVIGFSKDSEPACESARKLATGPEPHPVNTTLVETSEEPGRLAAGQFLGGSRLLKKLGEGAMGAVYLAENPELNRKSVIRVMSPFFNKVGDAAEQVKAYKSRWQSLDNDHLESVLQVGDEAGQAFVETELVEGQSLAKAAITGDWRRAAAVIRDAAEGLSTIHKAGLLHGEIDPEHVVVSESGRATLLGPEMPYRRDSDLELTKVGQCLGSPSFLYPRLVDGDSAPRLVEEIERRTTVRHFKQMYLQANYPLLVIISQRKIKRVVSALVQQVSSEAAFKVKSSNPIVQIKPVIPGCLCVPSVIDLDVTQSVAEAQFYLTPQSMGKLEGARVEVFYEGQRVDAIELDCWATTQAMAKLSGSVAAVMTTFGPTFSALGDDLKGQGAEGLGQLIGALGSQQGPVLSSVIFGLLSVLFYLWNRPKQEAARESLLSLPEF